MKYIIILLLLLNSANVFSQTIWAKQIIGGGFSGPNIYEQPNGNYIIKGVGIQEYDTNGNMINRAFYQDMITYSMVQTGDGSYAFTGVGWNNEFSGAILFKMSAEGDSLWTKFYGGDEIDRGYDLQQTADGGYFMVGYSESFYTMYAGEPQQQFGMYLIRTDEYGDTLWTTVHEYNVSGPAEIAYCVAKNEANNSYIVGGVSGNLETFEAYMYYYNIDDNGEVLWQHSVDYTDGFSTSAIFDIEPTNDGNFILAGGHSYDATNILSDAILIKINGEGETLQSNTYTFDAALEATEGLVYIEYAREVKATNDDGYIVIGEYGDFPTLWKVDENLEMQWYKQFTSSSVGEIRAVLPTSDGGYLLFGRHLPSGSFLIKTDSLGNCEPTASYDFSLTDSLSLSLTSSSIAANTVTWHFGDGDTLLVDTLQTQSIAHNYEEAGIYEVCLVAQNLCANDTLCQNINIGNVSSADFWKKSDLAIYPNPTKNEVYITAKFPKKVSQYNIRIYDATSCLLKEENNLSLHSDKLQTHFSLENYAKGIYFVEIVADEFSVFEKIVKF